MATKKQTKKKQASSLEFYKKLVLNQYMLNLFGVNSFEELSSEIKKVENEGYDENNNTIYCKELIEQFASQCAIPQGKLIQYDENIVKHTFRISEKRGHLIKWKYFQYLSLLFSEIYLDKYFSEPNKFLEELNEYVRSFNSDKEKADRIDEYTLEDLNKLAFWNATGERVIIVTGCINALAIRVSETFIKNNSCIA
ncbi:hypothetical protein N3C_2482 [Clostridium sp. N3C]|uniref:hypothetical protein n=1 Tax=Clostridium sp. N3C TaxID=1776758 RepID=UPI00092DF27A|nr:hypothetical protein [Clostridium sp. N3C]SCN25765.1 hypothetical protein N3C_2482 [Clostridium sp. N3C]